MTEVRFSIRFRLPIQAAANSMEFKKNLFILLFSPVCCFSNYSDTATIRSHLEILTNTNAFRNCNSVYQLNESASFIKNVFSKYSDHVSFQEFKASKSIRTKKFTGPPSLPGIDFSDHLNYWKFGFNAMMITDTAFYRNKNYHQVSDTIDTLDIARMPKVIDGIYTALLNI